MHQRAAVFLVAACWIGLMGCSGRGSEASELVTDLWLGTKPRQCLVPVGDDISVTETRHLSMGKGKMSLTAFQEIVPLWETAGLVEVVVEDVLSSDKQFSWEDWFARTQHGGLKTVTIEATATGLKLAEIRDGILVGDCYRETLEEVVSDQEVVVGVDRYRVIWS